MAFHTSILLIFIALRVSQVSCGVKIAPGAIISNDAMIEGHVTLGVGTIVSPGARIIAQGGPIIIGQGDIIQDRAVIINKIFKHTLFIGNGNIFGPGSRCEASRVGDGNILESNSFVSQRVQLSNGCIIKSGCHFTKPGYVPHGSIISGCNCQYGEMIDKSHADEEVNSTSMPIFQVIDL